MNANSSRLFLMTMTTLGLGCPATGAAADFCTGLRQVVAETGNQFRGIRGAPDFHNLEYRGTVTLGLFNKCATDTDGQVATYVCDVTLPDDEQAAVSLFQKTGEDVESCLGSGARREPSIDRSLFYTITETDDRITIRYHRLSSNGDSHPPEYVVSISVSYVGYSAK